MQAFASSRLFFIGGLALSAAFFATARADFINLPVKYSQPIGFNANGQIIGGDFSSDQTLNTVKADDFTDNYNDPVVAVRWWGSYGNTAQQADGFVGPFDISFHLSDGTPHPNSLPVNAPLATYVVNAQQVYVGLDTSPEPVYRYDAYLPTPFPETAGTEYFMAIDKPASVPLWGWHETPGPHPILDYAAVGASHNGPWVQLGTQTDFAFELMVPEPTSLALVAVGALGLMMRVRRSGA
ncbi:MAG: PEP-CTERM sorting domain-containing protein [Tepidisphaeraceae bacterium]